MANKLAFTLSGGGNRGALEVGALQSFVNHNIIPDLVVGTSAGALNGTFFCLHPDQAGVQQLTQIWLNTTSQNVFPGNILTAFWRVITGQDGLVDNGPLTQYVEKNLGTTGLTFGDMKIPLYVATTDLVSARLVAFGQDKSQPILEPVVASAAFPVVVEPVLLEAYQLTDGGVVSFSPIKIAAQHGAQEVYVIDLSPVVPKTQPINGMLNLITQILDTALRKGIIDDMENAKRAGIVIHHIQIPAYPDLSLFDFSKTSDLIAAGKAAVDAYLRQPQPNVIHRPSLAGQPPRGGAFVADSYAPNGASA